MEFIKKHYRLDEPFIQIIYLTFNTECNLKCKYCYVEKSFDKDFINQTINDSTFNKTFEFLERFIMEGIQKKKVSNNLSFIFYGSEPLIKKEYVKKAINKINELSKKINFKKEIQIITNGTLIDDEIISLFKEYNVEIAVSMDGSQEINDSMRVYKNDSGTYNKVLSSLKKLKENNVVFGISCTIGPHNVNNLIHNMTMFKNLGVGGVGFNILLKAKTEEIPFISYNYVNDKLIEASSFANENNIYEDRLQRKMKSFCRKETPHFKDCGAIGNQVVFYPNGDIGVCQAYLGCRDYIIGNVFKDVGEPLKILASESINKWTKRYPLNMKECYFCPAIGICGGGCAFNVEISEGNILRRDKAFCIHTIKALNWLLEKSVKEKIISEDIFLRDISFMFSNQLFGQLPSGQN